MCLLIVRLEIEDNNQKEGLTKAGSRENCPPGTGLLVVLRDYNHCGAAFKLLSSSNHTFAILMESYTYLATYFSWWKRVAGAW